MFRSYLKIAISILLRDRLYSAINILGLSVGLAACVLIALYVLHERSYEKHWDDARRIYRVNFAADMPGVGLTRFTEIPVVAMPALEAYFEDEIEASTRIIWRWGSRVLRHGENESQQVIYQVDPGFNDIFNLDLLAGDLTSTLASPGNIALREDVAAQIFGEQDPIGRTLTMDSSLVREFRVTAVYSVPGNTIMGLPTLTLLDEGALPAEMFSWISLTSDSYFKLAPGVDIDALLRQIPAFTDQHVDVSDFFPGPDIVASEVALYSFQPMVDIYLNSPWDTFRDLGNRSQVLAFSAIAALVLLIGCINFTILSTARMTQRAREVAMRKAIGARKGQLVLQFLGESSLLVLLAITVSLALVELMMPVFQVFTGKHISIDYVSATFLGALLILFITVSLLGGFYPAFVLSRFYPTQGLVGGPGTASSQPASLRNALVVFQFAIAIALLVATAVIYLQVRYSSQRDPGFNTDNLLVVNNIDARRVLYERMPAFKEEVLRIPQVTSAGFSTWQPSQQNRGFGSYDLQGEGAANFSIARTGIGYDFLGTYQIPLLVGRDFDEQRDQLDPIFNLDPDLPDEIHTAPRNVLINLSAARQMGFEDPGRALGRVIKSVNPEDGVREYTIIGVTADTHFYSLNALPRAEVFHLTPNRPNILSVHYEGSPQAVAGQLNEAWRTVMGDAELSYGFVDQLLAAEFEQERIESRMLMTFSLLAIAIACLGLYGSAAFTIARRTREISIRKVMGAQMREIVTLLLWHFSKPVLLANIIAWPVAMWAMLRWLQRFPYQIDTLLLVPLCVLAGALALSIAWLTVAGNAVGVASRRPVDALRYE